MDGLRLRRARNTQNQAKNGASVMMNSGLTACSQLAGISQPNSMRSVWRSANRLSEEPACSKPDQNIAAPTNRMMITPTRCFSRWLRPPRSNSQAK